MIKRFLYGSPYNTNSVIKEIEISNIDNPFEVVKKKNQLILKLKIKEKEVIYGLGETMRGINKRGHKYTSYNTDDPSHRDIMPSLYGAHNFFVLDESCLGIFVDTPAKVIFDLDSRGKNIVKITCSSDMNLYVIDGKDTYSIVREFLSLIGQSYIPPFWAFGYGQSRWGYKDEKDINDVVDGYKSNNMPLDYVCMDIDYMDRYIDFTINKENFKNPREFIDGLKERDGIRLVPIIDAGVKIEPGNETYDYGVEHDLFCHNIDGGLFKAAVWPGLTHFPDFLKPETREWFGNEYKKLTDLGIEGFWNDMNEPAIFYSEYTKKKNFIQKWKEKYYEKHPNYKLTHNVTPEAYKDYDKFVQTIDGKKVNHNDVHNLYGAFMTYGSSVQLKKNLGKRFLLFSRSSYIGSHRYGGIWLGDNHASWDMLRQNVYQMPGVNMCGYLYSGADLGGFQWDTNEELLLRWLAIGAFTPLMRNHCDCGSKPQECYRFENKDAFRNVLSLRYRIIPYLYSEFVKASIRSDVFMKPLSFDYPDDKRVRQIEDQILVGDSIMIAPIMFEGAKERNVYLPEDMTMVRYKNKEFTQTECQKGDLQICADIDEVVFFIKNNKCIIVSDDCNNTRDIDLNRVTLLGNGKTYEQYKDDGFSFDISEDKIVTLKK